MGVGDGAGRIGGTRRAFVLGAVLVAVGCSRIDGDLRLAHAPTFHLVDLALQPPRRQLATAVADVRVDNANAWPVIVESVDYALVVNGTLLGRTSQGTDLRVPARGNRTMRLSLPHPEGRHLQALRDRSRVEGLAYRLSGEAKVIGTGVDLVPFRLEGLRRAG